MSNDVKIASAEETAVANAIDDSFTANSIIEIIPIDSTSDHNHISEFLHSVDTVKPDSLNNVNPEPADESAVSTSL